MDLLQFIKESPTEYQAAEVTARFLEEAGYTRLFESESWTLEPGKGYYVLRNGSSLITFRIPENGFEGYLMSAAHSDSPYLKIKENAVTVSGDYQRFSTEKYGGMLCGPWFDRPLSVAGRIAVRTEDGFEMKNVDLKKPVCIIPSLCPHLQDHANRDVTYNAAVDMIPLYGGPEQKSFSSLVAEAAGVPEEDILATDLFVYNPQDGVEWNGFVSAPRIDDLQSAYALLTGYLEASASGSAPVYCLFDNEEVGSNTKQGAAGTFLQDVLARIGESLGLSPEEQKRRIANSFMVSCDNGHAVHPNHPEYRDPNHSVYMNGGIVIKYNANQSYTSDAASAALMKTVCARAGVPFQMYCNRADQRGGSTLGNISTSQVSVNTVDIGLAQLAMHSCYETAGARDTGYLIAAMKTYYSSTLRIRDGEFRLA